MSYLKDREIWLSSVPTGNPPAGYFWKFIQNGKVVVRDSSGNNQMMVATSGSQAITGSLTVTEGITGTVSSASYVEYSNVANKPALVSGSAQITYSGLTGIPSGIVSGSAQIASFGIFATTGSNGFNGSQSITGSLTVTGQVVAQTLNVQQVTSSIVYSSGSNIFGNSVSNTQQFTGSLQVSGSSHNILGNVGVGIAIPTNPLHIQSNTLSQLNVTALSGNTNAQINLEPTGTGIALIGPANNVDLAFRTNASIKLRLDKDGNLGLGVTPSAWNANSRALQLPSFISLSQQHNGALNLMSYALETSANTFTYADTGVFPARLNMNPNDGTITLFGAGTGTAGNAITWASRLAFTSAGAATFGSSITLQSNNALFVNNADNTRSGYLRTSNEGTELSSHNGAGEPLILIAPHSSATMRFYTAGSTSVNERMRITSDGNVLIGTNTSNAALLEVKQPTLAIASIFQAWAPGVAGANFRVISTTGQPYMQYDFNNGKMGVNLSNTEATLATLGGAVQIMGDYRNHQTIIKSAGDVGTYTGQLTITIPQMSNASTDGFGGYSCEVYVSGFSGAFCHVWFSGYINGGITAGEATILRSSGGWSISQASFGANNQGFQFVIDYPGPFLVHPTARIIFNKGGSTTSFEYPANSITAVFS